MHTCKSDCEPSEIFFSIKGKQAHKKEPVFHILQNNHVGTLEMGKMGLTIVVARSTYASQIHAPKTVQSN